MRKIALLALGLAAPALCGTPSTTVSASISWGHDCEYEYDCDRQLQTVEACYCGRPHHVRSEVEWRWETNVYGSLELRYRTIYLDRRGVRCSVGPWQVRVGTCDYGCRHPHVHHYQSSCGAWCRHAYHQPLREHRHDGGYRRPLKIYKSKSCNGGHGHALGKSREEHRTQVAPPEPVHRRPTRAVSSTQQADMKSVGVTVNKTQASKSDGVVVIKRSGTVPVSNQPRTSVNRKEVRKW